MVVHFDCLLSDFLKGSNVLLIIVFEGLTTRFMLQDGKRTLERELARTKISANRVASVVANDWKDENEKVMPVKQWLEERRFLQVRP